MKMKRYEKEFIHVNGIQQFMLHYPSTENNRDVLVFLHGGPGSATSNYGYILDEQWKDLFHVVYYDQRGAGKTLLKNKKELVHVEDMIEDLRQTIEYLKKKYDVNKVVILGHSWGSVLGTIFIQRYPELVRYYIGVGQVIDMMENEQVGYETVKKKIIEQGDKEDLEKLKEIGEYPDVSDMETFVKKCLALRKLQGKYKLAMSLSWKSIKTYMKSPIFTLRDILPMLKVSKVNMEIMSFLFENSFYDTSREYQVPIYYFLGDRDFQTPYTIAEKYFATIVAPKKKSFLIKDAGHFPNMDQAEQCKGAYQEIIKENLMELV
jgi:Predicted hydrolases or acyltransferases (alpha/beta hydrolase superfamily)